MVRRRSRWERFWDIPPSVAVACLAAVLGGYLTYGLTVVLGAVGTEFGAKADARPGSVAYYLGYSGTVRGTVLLLVRVGSLLSMVTTFLADRRGRRRLLLVAYTIGMAASLLTATAAALWMFVGFQIVARSGLNSTSNLVGTIAAEETDRHTRSRAVAAVAAAWGAGAGVGAMVYAATKHTSLGWRGLYLGGLVGLALVPVLSRSLTETKRFAALPGPVGHTWRRLLRPPYRSRTVRLAALHMLITVQGTPAGAFALVFAEKVRGLPSGRIAGVVVLAGPPGLLGLVASGRLADRLGRKPVGAAGLAVTAVAALGLYAGPSGLFAPSYWLLVTGAALAAPAIGTLGSEIFPTSARATASALVGGVSIVSAALSLQLFGILLDGLGSFGRATAVLTVGPALAIVMLLTLPETKEHEMEEISPEFVDDATESTPLITSPF